MNTTVCCNPFTKSIFLKVSACVRKKGEPLAVFKFVKAVLGGSQCLQI